MSEREGKVYLVGAGPGDPGLLTVKGRRCLERADAIVYDRLVSPRLLQYAKKNVELYYVGKSADHHTLGQPDIERLLVSLGDRGLQVVRLKGGDPFVFGRGGEEAGALNEAGIAWEVVPGITSSVSVPAYAGIPVTHRNVSPSFTVVTGHRAEEGGVDWSHYAKLSGTLVVLMGVRQLGDIVSGLTGAGCATDTPVALVRWGTRAMQETLVGTLGTIVKKVRDARFESPAVIVIGDVVQEREQLSWYERLVLMGKRIFVCAQTLEEMHAMAQLVEDLGAEAFGFCAEQLASTRGDDIVATMRDIRGSNAEERIGVYLRTRLGARAWFDALRQNKMDIRALAHVYFAAANEEVAEAISQYGIIADAVGSAGAGSLNAERWCCEALHKSDSDTGHGLSAYAAIAGASAVRYFRPYDLESSSFWVSLAKEWLAEGVDAVWATPGSAELFTTHIADSSGTRATQIQQPSGIKCETLIAELVDLLWQHERPDVFGAVR